MIHSLAAAVATRPAPDAARPTDPAPAVLVADRRHGWPVVGADRLMAAPTARHANPVFLNPAADHRAPDDLAFDLSAAAARALGRRLAAAPEVARSGRSVIVRGAVEVVRVDQGGSGGVRRFAGF